MYTIDNSTGDIVISGWERGIGDSPYTGLTDIRNININSIPGEADINFQTKSISSGAISGSIVSVTSSVFTFTGGTGLENYVAIYLTNISGLSGASSATPYWVGNLSGNTFKLYSDYNQANQLVISGSGTANFTAYQIGIPPSYVTGSPGGGPQYFAQPTNITASGYKSFLVDGSGMVWSNFYVTGTNSYWTYTGNTGWDNTNNSNANGNGLVYWRVSNNLTGSSQHIVDYLFVFRNSQIDYFVVNAYSGGPATGVWTYDWNPLGGTAGNNLTTPAGTNNSHNAIVGPDGRVYFCDSYNVRKFFQTSPTNLFNPSDSNTYTYTVFNILPINDVGQSIAPLGTQMLIGGQGYYIYAWDTTSNLASYYIPIAEPFIFRMVNVNTNVYIFAGNKGRIYITNGSQAQLWKKVPDHLSGTVEPRYQWGGAGSVKNQLYFSFKVTTQSGNPVTTEGALWAVDLDTGAIRISNLLSYGTYAGYATAMIPQIYNPILSVSPDGTGMLIGWDNGSNLFGVDTTLTTIYASGQSYVISDMLPTGTALNPNTPVQVEFKTAMPLLTGESIELQIGSYLESNFTSAVIVQGDGTNLILAGNSQNFPVQEQQWCLAKAILTGGTSATPSFNRLTSIRIVGATVKQTASSNLE